MGKSKYRTVVAAVLAGVVLFSPLLCGMTCLEGCGIRPGAAVEVVLPAEELVTELAESALVGCVLTHVVLSIDLSAWADVLNDGNWVWIGVKVVEMVRGALRGEASWK
jgi:hypothetical protein